jgi:cytosine/adenosine deaminase-related metal-dependent hydrolase
MVAPAQVDTCTEDLLRKSVCLARDTHRPLHIHAAQSYAEFQGMTRRHDMTPIEWLRSLDFLGPQTIIGHAVFTDEHPWLHWPTRNDLKLLSESNTSVAHSPTVFARDGTLMHNLGRYDRVGINIGIGTDTHPHNLIEEMRMAEILARVASGPTHSLTTSRIFDFATISGAQALLREDIGRISEGSQADLVLVDLKHPAMQPLYDPLRSLIYSAADRAILHTFIAGQHVVANGEVLTLDRQEGAVRLGEAQKRTAARVGRHDINGRQIEEIVSTTFPAIH